MTVGWRHYRYLAANNSLRGPLARMEARVSSRPLYQIPKNRVASIESKLRSGDIIGIISRDRGGLYSTAADYFRFAQMMLNGGELDGKRLLKKTTVDMMRTNVLNEQTLNSKSGIGPAQISPAQGFGYDFAVVQDPAAAKRQVGKGTFWWWGIAGTWFWIDPANDVVFVGIIQRQGGVPGAANHEDISRAAVSYFSIT